MRRLFSTLFLCILSFQLLFMGSGHAATNTLTLGIISDEPKTQIKKYDPLIQYIVTNLHNVNFSRGQVRVEKNISQMLSRMYEKKIDLFIGEGFVTAVIKRSANFQFLLQIPSLNNEKHYSVILVTQNSPIKKLRDLKGKIIAFNNPLSTFGYLLPKMFLLERGYKLFLTKKDSAPLHIDDINYLFSGADENSLLWLKRGKVLAAAIDAENFKREPKEVTNEFKVLEKTISTPPLFISYRSNLPSDIVEQIKIILKKMHQTESGKIILNQLNAQPKLQDISQSTLDFLLKNRELLQKEIKF